MKRAESVGYLMVVLAFTMALCAGAKVEAHDGRWEIVDTDLRSFAGYDTEFTVGPFSAHFLADEHGCTDPADWIGQSSFVAGGQGDVEIEIVGATSTPVSGSLDYYNTSYCGNRYDFEWVGPTPSPGVMLSWEGGGSGLVYAWVRCLAMYRSAATAEARAYQGGGVVGPTPHEWPGGTGFVSASAETDGSTYATDSEWYADVTHNGTSGGGNSAPSSGYGDDAAGEAFASWCLEYAEDTYTSARGLGTFVVDFGDDQFTDASVSLDVGMSSCAQTFAYGHAYGHFSFSGSAWPD